MTTEQQIAQVRAAADQMAFMDRRIKSVHVDDWDDSGGFNLFVHLAMVNVTNLTGIVKKLKRIARVHNLRWEWCDAPKRQYTKSFHRSYFTGYNRNNYKISLRA